MISQAKILVIKVGSSLVIFLTAYVSLWQPELVREATAAEVAEETPPISEAPSPSEPAQALAPTGK